MDARDRSIVYDIIQSALDQCRVNSHKSRELMNNETDGDVYLNYNIRIDR
jgi:hypothetical protein